MLLRWAHHPPHPANLFTSHHKPVSIYTWVEWSNYGKMGDSWARTCNLKFDRPAPYPLRHVRPQITVCICTVNIIPIFSRIMIETNEMWVNYHYTSQLYKKSTAANVHAGVIGVIKKLASTNDYTGAILSRRPYANRRQSGIVSDKWWCRPRYLGGPFSVID